MILRTITCDVRECGNSCTEEIENAGFPGWGHIQGLMCTFENGRMRDIAYVCPKCLSKLKQFMNNGGFV